MQEALTLHVLYGMWSNHTRASLPAWARTNSSRQALLFVEPGPSGGSYRARTLVGFSRAVWFGWSNRSCHKR